MRMARVLCFLLFVSLSMAMEAWGQRKELDEEAYLRWRRVDDWHLSANGEWVLYRYLYFDNEEANEACKDIYYLYGVRDGKTDTLRGIENPCFWAGGEWMCYEKDGERIGVRLKDGRRETWREEVELNKWWPWVIRRKDKGLVAENVETGRRVVREGVVDYVLGEETWDGVFLVQEGKVRKLYRGNVAWGDWRLVYEDRTGTLSRFYFDETGKRGRFFVQGEEGNDVYVFEDEGGVKKVLDGEQLTELGMDDYSLLFCGNGRYVVYALAGGERAHGKEKNGGPELWKWNAERIPPRTVAWQNEAERRVYDRQRDSSYVLCDGRHGDLHFPSRGEGVFAYEKEEGPYRIAQDWQNDLRFDLYLVDVRDGSHHLLARALTREVRWSPQGDYLLYFDNATLAWVLVEPKTLKQRNLGKEIPYPLWQENHDRPNPAPPYGVAGWSDDGEWLFLYDRFDVWAVSLDEEEKTFCRTAEWGRQHSCRLRLLDDEETSVTDKSLLRIWNEDTKDSGAGKFSRGKGVKLLTMEACDLQVLEQGGNAFLCYRQSYEADRDLWICDSSFKEWRKVTNANPQQGEYAWGTVRQVSWEDDNHKTHKGLLYLPETYDSTKGCPMIVSFYEAHSPELHMHPVPGLSMAMIDVPTYVSKGYAVFSPDVYIEIGKPVESACRTVISGVETLLENGVADEARIGLQGHSWSGYLVAAIVTRTNLFRCVNVGAATVNLPAVYVSLRGDGNVPNMLMYEDWQCRMGKTLWEDLPGYLENSPILFADRIHTPMLIFHNDRDGAVAYTEGMALFLAMRRLQRPAWLVNYPGEGHFLYSREARKDWTGRLEAFFNYYLKDGPEPEWMK